MTNQVTCDKCRFWEREYDSAGHGNCNLANGDAQLADRSYPRVRVESQEWGGREASMLGSTATAALITDQDFYCYHAELKTPECTDHDWRPFRGPGMRYCSKCHIIQQLQEVEPTPVAPSLKQRFGDWIDARTAQGIETYGGPLTTDNGRDAERDMLEELLDFCQYQEQSRLELLADNARLRQRIGVARERLGLPELEGLSSVKVLIALRVFWHSAGCVHCRGARCHILRPAADGTTRAAHTGRCEPIA